MGYFNSKIMGPIQLYSWKIVHLVAI